MTIICLDEKQRLRAFLENTLQLLGNVAKHRDDGDPCLRVAAEDIVIPAVHCLDVGSAFVLTCRPEYVKVSDLLFPVDRFRKMVISSLLLLTHSLWQEIELNETNAWLCVAIPLC